MPACVGNDPAIGVDWGVEAPLLSDKDTHAPPLADMISVLGVC